MPETDQPLAASHSTTAVALRQGAVERILVLTPSGPFLMDVRILVEGQPLSRGLDVLVDQVLNAAKLPVDGGEIDSGCTWAALMANEHFLKSQMRGGQRISKRQRGLWIETYDLNHDGVVQRSEAAAWLGRDTGSVARAFALRSSRSYRPDQRASSRIWSATDADGDGLVSSEELHGAHTSLLALDANGDETLTPPELVSLRDQVRGETINQPSSGREFQPYAAIHLEPDVDIARIEYLLTDLYTPRQELRTESFLAFVSLGKELDENEDGWLAQEELAGLLEAHAQLEISVDFHPENKESHHVQAAASLNVLSHASEVLSIETIARGRVVAAVGDTGLVISAHDLGLDAAMRATPVMPSSDVNRSQIRVMIHDQYDGLFHEIDANRDGRLSAREVAHSPERILHCDQDGDGQISGSELPYVMIVAILRGELGNEQSFYAPPSPLEPSVTASGGPAWFRHGDFNGDGDISRREFLGAPQQFSKLDRNKDGFIDPGEVTSELK